VAKEDTRLGIGNKIGGTSVLQHYRDLVLLPVRPVPHEYVIIQLVPFVQSLAPWAADLVVRPLSLKEAVDYVVLIYSHDTVYLLRKYSDFVAFGCLL